MNLDVSRFLESLTGRHARLYTANVNDLATAMLMQNEAAEADALARLDEVIRETMGVAEILGATLVQQAAARVIGKSASSAVALAASFRDVCGPEPWGESSVALQNAVDELVTFATQTIVPRVGFAEALQDMVDRAPVTIRAAAERTSERIAQLYGEGNRVVAFVKSAEEAVTKKVQSVIAQAIADGSSEVDAAGRMVAGVEEVSQLTEEWSEGYARMAFRTNVNQAVTNGRRRQVEDPDIKAVIPAFRFDAAGPPISQGGDTRENHYAMNGVVLRVDNPAWDRLGSPLGFN